MSFSANTIYDVPGTVVGAGGMANPAFENSDGSGKPIQYSGVKSGSMADMRNVTSGSVSPASTSRFSANSPRLPNGHSLTGRDSYTSHYNVPYEQKNAPSRARSSPETSDPGPPVRNKHLETVTYLTANDLDMQDEDGENRPRTRNRHLETVSYLTAGDLDMEEEAEMAAGGDSYLDMRGSDVFHDEDHDIGEDRGDGGGVTYSTFNKDPQADKDSLDSDNSELRQENDRVTYSSFNPAESVVGDRHHGMRRDNNLQYGEIRPGDSISEDEHDYAARPKQRATVQPDNNTFFRYDDSRIPRNSPSHSRSGSQASSVLPSASPPYFESGSHLSPILRSARTPPAGTSVGSPVNRSSAGTPVRSPVNSRVRSQAGRPVGSPVNRSSAGTPVGSPVRSPDRSSAGTPVWSPLGSPVRSLASESASPTSLSSPRLPPRDLAKSPVLPMTKLSPKPRTSSSLTSVPDVLIHSPVEVEAETVI